MAEGVALLADGRLEAARSSWEKGLELALPETKPTLELMSGVAAAAEGDFEASSSGRGGF